MKNSFNKRDSQLSDEKIYKRLQIIEFEGAFWFEMSLIGIYFLSTTMNITARAGISTLIPPEVDPAYAFNEV